ncbi:GGDEF domain-containing protein [Pseudomonas syringae]|uniref:GGDEF domain-containing protein n=1 Tax=Pseudomonas syringae TaxID=317 RepID=UPI001F0DE8CB|nr:GGDEF domain-containing protein [Pseudomonas syringae]MCH5655461.1 GGDEF domain-containing protein [Pseudomonas syringae]
MREYIDIPVLVNLVSMMRSETVGAILLVDHETEGRFYDSLAHQTARVIPSPAMAIEILSSASRRGIAGLAAAVRGGRATEDLASFQFHPSLGDTSSLLICSPNFERAIINATGRTWYVSCEKEIGSLAVRCAALACALERVATVKSLSLDTEALLDFVDWSLLGLLEESVVGATSLEAYKEINSLFETDSKKALRELLLCCDGDLAISIVSSAIERYQPHGLKADSIVSKVEVSKMLELSYPLESIEDDPVFWKMRKWERSNPRYSLLRQWRTLDPFNLVWDQRYWDVDLKSLLSLGESGGGLSLIKLDLDNFKSVNTSLGHGGGDEAIKIASRVILSITIGVGEVYRRGGDEFIIIAPDLRGDDAENLSERIRSEIESVFLVWGGSKGLEIFPTASIGVIDADYGICFAELTEAADQTQQLAKDSGKNISIYKKLTVKES